jgi:hypothetical protein
LSLNAVVPTSHHIGQRQILRHIPSQAALQHLTVDQRFAPMHHPQSNGLVERFISTLRGMIATPWVVTKTIPSGTGLASSGIGLKYFIGCRGLKPSGRDMDLPPNLHQRTNSIFRHALSTAHHQVSLLASLSSTEKWLSWTIHKSLGEWSFFLPRQTIQCWMGQAHHTFDLHIIWHNHTSVNDTPFYFCHGRGLRTRLNAN